MMGGTLSVTEEEKKKKKKKKKDFYSSSIRLGRRHSQQYILLNKAEQRIALWDPIHPCHLSRYLVPNFQPPGFPSVPSTFNLKALD